jgi:hypothetical protein
LTQRAYIDTSAALKLVHAESESLLLRKELRQFDLFSADLLETEIRRAAGRTGIPQGEISELLKSIALIETARPVYRAAGLLGATPLRSLDAIHLAVALRAGLETIVTYDSRMVAAAMDLGMNVFAPSP